MIEPMIEEDKLQAYVDGALPPEEAARMVLYLADHPEEQARADAMMALNETLAAAYAAPMDEPVPQAIHDAIMNAPRANVLPFARARRAALGLGLAAALAIVAYLPWQGAARMAFPLGPVGAASPLGEALSRAPSGQSLPMAEGTELRLTASFATPAHGMCREAELRGADGAPLQSAIACRTGDGPWQVEIALAYEAPSANPAQTGYSAASGAEDDDPIGRFLDSVGASFALSPEEEARAIARDWRGD